MCCKRLCFLWFVPLEATCPLFECGKLTLQSPSSVALYRQVPCGNEGQNGLKASCCELVVLHQFVHVQAGVMLAFCA